MTNLIFNAVDALPTGGTIRLRVAADNEQAVIEVTDSGAGMTTEVQERIFEPFFTTKRERGAGLGFAMVFGILEKRGSHMGARSATGEVATLRVALPLARASADHKLSPQARHNWRRPVGYGSWSSTTSQ